MKIKFSKKMLSNSIITVSYQNKDSFYQINSQKKAKSHRIKFHNFNNNTIKP